MRFDPSSTGTEEKVIISFWIKRGNLSTLQTIIEADNDFGGDRTLLAFNESNQLYFYKSKDGENYLTTDAVFSDPTQWYHVYLKVDTTEVVQTDRITIVVNGVEQSDLTAGGGWPDQNDKLGFSTNSYQYYIGADTNGNNRLDALPKILRESPAIYSGDETLSFKLR